MQERHHLPVRPGGARRDRRGPQGRLRGDRAPAPLAAAQQPAARCRLARRPAGPAAVRPGPVPAQGGRAPQDLLEEGRPARPPGRLGREARRPRHRRCRDRLPGRPRGQQGVGLGEPAHPDAPRRAAPAREPQGLVRRRPHRLLGHLHAPGLPGEALRAADPPPVLPVPPVDVRRRQRRARCCSARPRATCLSWRSPWTRTGTSWRKATTPSPSAPASGSASHDRQGGQDGPPKAARRGSTTGSARRTSSSAA